MSLSIILPTLNEAATIAATVRSLRLGGGDIEIIVADGGSTDGTVEQAALADRVLRGPRGRAAQMNLGAEHARGDVLLFLHADCALEAGALAGVRDAFKTRKCQAACFTMRVAAEGFWYRCIDWCASARVRLTGIVYGDQGLAIRARDFHALGGFPRVRFLEDVLFSKRLRSRCRPQVLPWKVFVSPRRWQKHGLVRQTLRNWTLLSAALAGVPPDRLAEYYAPQSA